MAVQAARPAGGQPKILGRVKGAAVAIKTGLWNRLKPKDRDQGRLKIKVHIH